MATVTRWTLDPDHSLVALAVKHMMFTTVRGRFTKLSGTVTIDPERPDRSQVEVAIDAATIDTGVEARDAHLRSADFLDVEHHPAIAFRSVRVAGAHSAPGDRFRMVGLLTIRGQAREVALEATVEGVGSDLSGSTRVGFSARTEIDRREWGLTWNQGLETGGVLVGHTVKIEIEAQAVRQEVAEEAAALV